MANNLNINQEFSLYNEEIEQELIGLLLIDNKYFEKVYKLTKDYFYFENHQIIFDAIKDSIEKNEQINEVNLFYKLQKKIKNFQSDDDLKNYIRSLVDIAYGSISSIEILSNLIKDFFYKRELLKIRENISSYISAEDEIEKAIIKTESDIYKILNQDTKNEPKHVRDFSSSVRKKFKEAKNSKNSIRGIETNFTDLDKHLGGLHNSDLIIVAARPSMGKTALAINIAYNIANNARKKGEGGGVLFFSLEMSGEQISSRMVSLVSGSSIKAIHTARTGEENRKLNDSEFQSILESMEDLEDLPFFIDDTASISISHLKTRARYLKRKYNISVILIDYLQLITAVKNTNNRVQEISEITQNLKAIAKELNIPVIALSQLSRAVETVGRTDKRPKLSDLRESGTIEQDADIVTFLYREAYYLEREISVNDQDSSDQESNERNRKNQEKLSKCKNIAELIIAKNRNGPVGTITLSFDPSKMQFRNIGSDFESFNIGKENSPVVEINHDKKFEDQLREMMKKSDI